MFRVLFGILFGLAIAPIALVLWLYNGKVPVAVTDTPFPYEEQLTHVPLDQRIDKELIQMPPVMPTEETFVAGARVYAQHCAVCHGFHGKPSSIGQSMYPDAPQLWEKHHASSVVGVSDDQPGETYWKVANGIRLTGMPEYRTQLTNDEMWQVSLLLANADKPLPPGALTILKTGTVPDAPLTDKSGAPTADTQ